jgi:chromatin assembly factor 1 subunit A
VRSIQTQLSEAEVVGDTALVRDLVALLRNREIIPAKVLIHVDDIRPGYYGTHTKSSRFIGARTPLAKDEVALDYSYDSGEDWEGEEEGAGEDVADDDDEGDIDADAPDSDLDSWLVDDDEVEDGEDHMSPFSEFDTGDLALLEIPPAKRKVDRGKADEEVTRKKRKVVVPLVPFTKGPCLERVIGTCQYDAFTPYRIHLFNGMSMSSVNQAC